MALFKHSEINEENVRIEKQSVSDTFVDKIRTDFNEGLKSPEKSNKFIDTYTDAPKKGISDEITFVERIPDMSNLESMFGIPDSELLAKININYGFELTKEEIFNSVKKASDFFHLSLPNTIREGCTTGVLLGMEDKDYDDILIFNKNQMQQIGITDSEGFDLVMTHEAAHRALQFIDARFSPHNEESFCDYLVGVRAGLNEMNEDKLIHVLEECLATNQHPSGLIRVQAIKSGVQFAHKYMLDFNEPPTFSKCLEHFKKNIDDISSEAYYTHSMVNLKEEAITNDELKAFIDDKSYHIERAKVAKEWAEWHYKCARNAEEKGDLSSAKDNIYTAQTYERKAKEHLDAADKCTK